MQRRHGDRLARELATKLAIHVHDDRMASSFATLVVTTTR